MGMDCNLTWVCTFQSHALHIFTRLTRDCTSTCPLTFKAERTGPNITPEQAKLNSDEWYQFEVGDLEAAIEAIPSSAAFDTESEVESAPSEAGSSASHAATPPSSGRRNS